MAKLFMSNGGRPWDVLAGYRTDAHSNLRESETYLEVNRNEKSGQ
jgi:hypothetical protein